MHRRTRVVLIVAGLGTTVSVSLAQTRGPTLMDVDPQASIGIVPDHWSVWILFSQPWVQRELKLTEAQRLKVTEHMEQQKKQAKKMREGFEAQRKEAGENLDREAKRELLRIQDSQLRDLSSQSEAELVKILDPVQLRRLREIHVQIEGPAAFDRPEMQAKLNLSPEQIELIHMLYRQGRGELVDQLKVPPDLLPDPRRYSPEERKELKSKREYKDAVFSARRAALKVRASTMQKIAKVLTKNQRERYERMVGEPFDFLTALGLQDGSRPSGGKSDSSPPGDR